MMKVTNTPVVALTNTEYLCLKVAANPGHSARWYLRALSQYRRGYPGKGSWNAFYFSPSRPSGRGRYFVDTAPKTRTTNGWSPRSCSETGSIRLTYAGVLTAQTAAAKIGLDPKTVHGK